MKQNLEHQATFQAMRSQFLMHILSNFVVLCLFFLQSTGHKILQRFMFDVTYLVQQ